MGIKKEYLIAIIDLKTGKYILINKNIRQNSCKQINKRFEDCCHDFRLLNSFLIILFANCLKMFSVRLVSWATFTSVIIRLSKRGIFLTYNANYSFL